VSVAAQLALPSAASAGHQARSFIAERLAGLSVPPETADTVVLVASELVSNAVLHGDPPVELRLQAEEAVIRLEISDGAETLPQPRDYGLQAVTGRGLGLVAALSRGWGAERRPDGKVVWAEVATDGSGEQEVRLPDERPTDGIWGGRVTTGPGTVRYRVPVATYLELQEHNDALCREAELIGLAAAFPEPGNPEPDPDLLALLGELRPALEHPPEQMRATVHAAWRAGQDEVDLVVRLDPALAPRSIRHVELLERADDYARAGLLLTPPVSDAVAKLRRDMLRQMTEQLG
jgi:anti-sigma regulatory factor (Ser/Thr protein kinase)